VIGKCELCEADGEFEGLEVQHDCLCTQVDLCPPCHKKATRLLALLDFEVMGEAGLQTVGLDFYGRKGACTCGHLGDGQDNDHHDLGAHRGHGACRECSCTRFTWDHETPEFKAWLAGLPGGGQ
jgi:hypothetical protein